MLTTALLMSPPASCCSGMANFASDPAFIAAHLSPLPFAFTSKAGGAMVTFAAGSKAANGFYIPAKEGNKAAVVVVHEWWGLNDYIKKYAERLHDDLGVAVLAVDMYDGKVTADRNEAAKLMQGFDGSRGKSIVKGAVTALSNGKFGSKSTMIGSVGFCFGGGWSFQTAVESGPKVQACVVYYGAPDLAGIPKLKAPVLFVHPEQDKWITSDMVKKFTAAMGAAKKRVNILHYNNDHAFANPSNPKYDKLAAEDAYGKSLVFFRVNLKLPKPKPVGK